MILLALILFTLVVRGRAAAINQDALFRDVDGYGRISRQLFEHRTFREANNTMRTGTAYRPPLYPLLLVPSNAWPQPQVFVGWMHVILGAATVWGTWRLGQLCGLPDWGSAAAGVLVAVDPILVNQSVLVMSETLAALLSVWSMVALVGLMRSPSVRRAVAAGAMIGLCALCRPEFLVWFACLAIALPFVLARRTPRAALLCGTFVTIAALVVAPWPLRNWIQFGRPIITTTHGGYTMLLGNNPDFYEYLRTGAWGTVWNASAFNAQWSAELAWPNYRRNVGGAWQRDELAADARAYELAFENIRAEPGMFAYACLVRVGRLWAVLPHATDAGESPAARGLRYSVAIWYVSQFALALVGVRSLGRKLLASPWLWGLLLAVSLTAVHTVYWSNMRMRAPLVPWLALLAVAGAVWLASGRQAVTSRPATS